MCARTAKPVAGRKRQAVGNKRPCPRHKFSGTGTDAAGQETISQLPVDKWVLAGTSLASSSIWKTNPLIEEAGRQATEPLGPRARASLLVPGC